MIISSRAGLARSTSRRSWLFGIGLGLLCLAGGLWGYLAEDPGAQNAMEALAYVVLPVLMFGAVLASGGRRRAPILIAVGLLDVEAALLGAAPQIALPFVVAVPLVGVAVAARLVPRAWLRGPYIAAWLASSAGISIAVLASIKYVSWTAVVVVPAFLAVDAVALAMLWRLDAGRLRAVEAAEEAEARVRDLLNGVDLLGVHIARDARVDFINDFALRLTGWRREEVLGADWWDIFATPERRESARAEWTAIMSGRVSMRNRRESTIVTRTGERRLIGWSHVLRQDSDGLVAGMASLGEDLTAIRAAEQEARRGAEMLSTLVVSSPLPTIVVGRDLAVQLWNPAAVELVGWSEDEVMGRPIPSTLYASDRLLVGRHFVRAMRGESFEGELVELCRKDGETVRVRLYGGALRDRDGEPMSVAIQAVDVTVALAMEDHLRESQKMEAVGRLAGGVAHDFNNSLTAIGGFASLIASGTNEPETREAAETILGASNRAADLTRELLAYSRRSLLQPQTIDILKLLSDMRPMLRRILGEDVVVVVESRLSTAIVRVDPNGLERVLLNLAANARDAMEAGGSLTISTDRRAADVDLDPSGPAWVVVSVSDTGAGIPADLHSRVFEPFFTTKPVGGGTGLGLAMVKGFVVQSGGKVSLRSDEGRGTTVEIMLPEIADGSQSPAADVVATQALRGDETILVVEDEPAVAAVSFQVLTRAGYRVLLADSGAAATKLLRGNSDAIHLMLIDVVLPDMRAPQLVEHARTAHPEAGVVYVSGYSAEAIARRGDLPPGAELIEKPYAPEQLLRRVRLAIDGREPQ